MRWRIILLSFAVTIPLILGLHAWQTENYAKVDDELSKLEDDQREWLESNKRLIAGLSVLGSRDRIERIARDDLKLTKRPPEAVLQIQVKKGRGIDG